LRVKDVSATVHVNHWSDDTLQSSRTTDIDTVAAVFMSKHAQDMIATRKRRFLDASIFLFSVLVLVLEARVKTRTFFVISYHDILNRSAKKDVLFSVGRIISLQPFISCKDIQMNIHKSNNRQTRQNKTVNALLQTKWTLLQHRHERERHQSNDVQKEEETLGIQNSYVSPHESFSTDTDAN
jgi:hypothetical protein